MRKYLWNLVAWLTGYGLASPTVTVSLWKSEEFGGCFEHRAGHLSWSSVSWNPKEVGFTTSKGLQDR